MILNTYLGVSKQDGPKEVLTILSHEMDYMSISNMLALGHFN